MDISIKIFSLERSHNPDNCGRCWNGLNSEPLGIVRFCEFPDFLCGFLDPGTADQRPGRGAAQPQGHPQPLPVQHRGQAAGRAGCHHGQKGHQDHHLEPQKVRETQSLTSQIM